MKQCSVNQWKSDWSNPFDDAIEGIFTEGELEEVVSGKHGDEQNNLTEDPAEEVQLESPKWTSNNLVDNADMKGQYLLTSRKKQVQKISHLQKW